MATIMLKQSGDPKPKLDEREKLSSIDPIVALESSANCPSTLGTQAQSVESGRSYTVYSCCVKSRWADNNRRTSHINAGFG